MIKGIIFDFGGTLDTGGDHWSHIIREAWQKCGVAADDALFREAYVYGEQQLERTEEILPSHDFSDVLDIKIQMELTYLARTGNFAPAEIEAKAKEIAAYCYDYAKQKTADSKVVLEQLAKQYPLVLVSNFYGNLDTVLQDFGLYECFKRVVESAKEGVRKPHPSLLEIGIKALGFKPEEILVVGDSVTNDIEPAKKLGCKTLLLEGRKWEEDVPLDIHGIDSIRSLDQIFKVLMS